MTFATRRMSFRRSRLGRGGGARGIVVLAFVLAAPFAFGAKDKKSPKKAKDSGDTAPVLLSTTGGGTSWADVKELTAAADKGNPAAQAQLGDLLWRGDADLKVAPDRDRALVLLEKAARAGEAAAAFRMGMLFDDGDGVPQDRDRALAYFRAAAAGGAAAAFHNIGAAYASGRGVRRDYTEALAWLIVAKKKGASDTTEAALRSRLQSAGRAAAIASAEKRAEAIETELAATTVIAQLPPPSPALESLIQAASAKKQPEKKRRGR